jgi:hypothetical protein
MMTIKEVGWEIESEYPRLWQLRDDVMMWMQELVDHVSYTDDGSIGGWEYRFRMKVDWWLSDEFVKFARQFPFYIRQEARDGNHLHFSFINDRYYDNVVNNIFALQSVYIEQAYREQDGKYLKRLYNHYSKVVLHTNIDIWERERYYFVNLLAKDKHNTLEVRVLPFFETSDEIIKWIRLIIKSVNAMSLKLVKEENYGDFRLIGKWMHNFIDEYDGFNTTVVRYFGREDIKIRAIEKNEAWKELAEQMKQALEMNGIRVFDDDFHELPWKDGAINLAIFRVKDFHIPLVPIGVLQKAAKIVSKVLRGEEVKANE